ncbi:unnamed protein product [Adineta steineri]|uniref:Uncharacterized protein n=1 Tax=Adineta steineri TaxID=433720 RepID=A0A820P4Q3_9BILA|nr:unnamed protein product [Adineta steineri]
MKSTVPLRVHLNVCEQSSQYSSFDQNRMSVSSTVIHGKNKLNTTIPHSISANLDCNTPKFARFSSVSSSYTQFLKQRDMDKVKKIVSDTQKNLSTNCKVSQGKQSSRRKLRFIITWLGRDR